MAPPPISHAKVLALQSWRRPRIETEKAWCGAVVGVHAHAVGAAPWCRPIYISQAEVLALQPWRRPRIEAVWAWRGAVR